MTSELPTHANPPQKQRLEKLLAHYLGRDCDIADLTCCESKYSSSHLLYELQVDLNNGHSLKLVYKSIGPTGLSPSARRVKPEFVYSARREADAYSELLTDRDLGTPVFYGLDAERGVPRGLLLEHVSGVEIYQIGELAVWETVARWLARFHATFLSRAPQLEIRVPSLLRRDEKYFKLWKDRALGHLSQQDEPALRQLLQKVIGCYDRAVDLLLDLPPTLVHGEFYASNALVDILSRPVRVAAVDWEMAGVGPGLLDLAALVSGWPADQVIMIARVYYEELQSCNSDVASWEHFCEQLTACRLQQAVQWLGWSAGWQPPAAHAQDWLSIAAELCD